MIGRNEIMEFSREFILAANVIEKDYLLGWLLAGISNHPDLSKNWVFKGGTCLKKCYFETYRFSEDLDFTVINSEHQNEGFLINTFKVVADWVYEATGIEIPKETIRFDVYTNPRGKISVQGKISYRGPLQPGGSLPRIKLDLTDDEVLVLNPVSREVHHPYSDKPQEGIKIQAYCFEELFAEKIRALAERLRPRDLYDVVHLHRHYITKYGHDIILSTLKNKCTFKDISVPTMDILENKPERTELETEWENMLGHQVPVLPNFEQFWKELPELFEWLYYAVKKAIPPTMPLMGQAIDVTWQPPTMAQAWNMSTPLEAIRFAAANHLCVDLIYQGSSRLIEPYSLRRTHDGNLLLYAVKHNTGEIRSYRVDRVQGTQITKVTFMPRYAIELATLGQISAPPTIRTGGIENKISHKIRPTSIKTRSSISDDGPKYVFECNWCGKRFIHKSHELTLKKHKDKQGYPCPGRTGFFVTTKY